MIWHSKIWFWCSVSSGCSLFSLGEYEILKYSQNFSSSSITVTPCKQSSILLQLSLLFKICILTYIALNTGKPAYLRNKLNKFSTKLEVSIKHSHDPHRLNEPRMNKQIGTRSFKYSAPRLFNSLPRRVKDSGNLKTFKKKLKTFLFNECYDYDTKTITDRHCI